MRRRMLPTLAAVVSVTLLGAGSAVAGGGVALAAGTSNSSTTATSSTTTSGVARSADQQVVRASHTSGGTTWQGVTAGRTAPRMQANAIATADIRVTYSSAFSASAKAAFQAAVDIWKTQIRSSVPINIAADWTPLGTDVLGQAGPVNFRRDFTGAPIAGTYYPDALANTLAGHDLDPANPEIQATFNSSFATWYLGTDGRPDSNHYDFESVVLHELGHGLGLVGTFDGYTAPNWTDQGRGYWGLDGAGDKPTIFDRLVVDGFGRDGLNTGSYPQGSTALGSMLRGSNGGIQWKGSEGVLANSGNRPRLFSPGDFREGSSVSHLDEVAYPAGSANALMTPYLQNGESVHDPGPILRGMFQDMGWGAPTTCTPAVGITTDRLVSQVKARRGTLAMTGGVTFNLPMTGRAGVPTSGVDAVLATVEITKPTSSGFLAVGSGCGGATTSAQQYTNGVSRSTLVAVPLDSLGRMQLRISGGAASVSVYVHGWYQTGGTTTGLFTALPKTRINGSSGAVISPSAPNDVATAGVAGIPSGVDAVLLNITVLSPSAAGSLLVGPGGTTMTYADQSYSAGRSISQLVVVRPSAVGKIRLALSAGTARVYADVWGYYGAATATSGDVLHRVQPQRVLQAATAPDVTFTVPGLPSDVHSVLLVATVTGATTDGYLGAGRGGTSGSLPGVVQYYKGDPIANTVVVPVGADGRVRLKLSSGTGKLYADLLGYNAGS